MTANVFYWTLMIHIFICMSHFDGGKLDYSMIFMHGLWWAGKMLNTTWLASMLNEVGKRKNKCDVAFTAASYECVHVNTSHEGTAGADGAHAVWDFSRLTLCSAWPVGVRATEWWTGTQDTWNYKDSGWFQPWFYLCFGYPQDIHTKKNKRERQTKKACPHPGPSCFRTQMSEQLLMAGEYIQTCLGWRKGWNGSIEWRFHMMGGGRCKTERNVWLDWCRAGDWLSFPVDMSSPCKTDLFTSACQEETAVLGAKAGNHDL